MVSDPPPNPDISAELNIISRVMVTLVDDSNAYRTHNAIAIYAALILGVCTMVMTFACIYSSKSLAYELGILVTALAGLTGYQFSKGMDSRIVNSPPSGGNNTVENSSSTQVVAHPPVNNPSNPSNNTSPPVVSRVDDTAGDG